MAGLVAGMTAGRVGRAGRAGRPWPGSWPRWDSPTRRARSACSPRISGWTRPPRTPTCSRRSRPRPTRTSPWRAWPGCRHDAALWAALRADDGLPGPPDRRAGGQRRARRSSRAPSRRLEGAAAARKRCAARRRASCGTSCWPRSALPGDREPVSDPARLGSADPATALRVAYRRRLLHLAGQGPHRGRGPGRGRGRAGGSRRGRARGGARDRADPSCRRAPHRAGSRSSRWGSAAAGS